MIKLSDFTKLLTGLFLLLAFNYSAVAYQDLTITIDEDRSEYFRNEILNNLTKQQILNFLIKKDIAEKSEAKELGAKYILNLTPPFDRKIDADVAVNWNSLSPSERDALRFEWFQKNKNSISTRELQKYIMVNDLVEKARDAEMQRKKREGRAKIEFANVMSDSQFLVNLEKTVKSVVPAAPVKEPVKIAAKDLDIEKTTVSKKSKKTGKKTTAVKQPQPKKQSKSKKSKKKDDAAAKTAKRETGAQPKPADDLLSKIKTRDLDIEELKKAKPQEEDVRQFDDKIKSLQSRISNLKTQLNTTATEIDSLRNLKTAKPQTQENDDSKRREDIRKRELEKIKSIGND